MKSTLKYTHDRLCGGCYLGKDALWLIRNLISFVKHQRLKIMTRLVTGLTRVGVAPPEDHQPRQHRKQPSRDITWDTLVLGREVGDKVLPARLDVEQVWIWYPDDAGLPARAAGINVCEDICRAAHEVILLQAPPQPHPAVVSRPHQYHLILPTGGVEALPLAVLRLLCRT